MISNIGWTELKDKNRPLGVSREGYQDGGGGCLATRARGDCGRTPVKTRGITSQSLQILEGCPGKGTQAVPSQDQTMGASGGQISALLKQPFFSPSSPSW